MHAGLVRHYIEVEAVLIAPICPHFSEHVWRVILGKSGSVFKARFPTSEPADANIIRIK